MRRCEECGARFKEGTETVEYLGECHGRPIYVASVCCPACGGVFFPARAPRQRLRQPALSRKAGQ